MFRELLTEKGSSEILSKIYQGHIPISPKAFERVFGTKTRYYFHTLELLKIHTLQRMQGTRKTISCFDQWDGYSILWGAEGIDLEIPIVAVLKGKVAFRTPEDNYSYYDSQGRRWINIMEITNVPLKNSLTKISGEIQSKFKSENPELWDLLSAVYDYEEISNKDKAAIIQKYIDVAGKVISRSRGTLLSLASQTTSNYSEVLGYDFKIVKLMTTREVERPYGDILDFQSIEIMRDSKELFKELEKYTKMNMG